MNIWNSYIELRNEEINVKKILNIWISYIHNFIFIFPGYITNQFNDQLPVGLLAQLVRALHRYRRGQGSNPGKPDFFRLSFRNCISCVNNCEDLLYIYFFIPQFNIWISYIHNFIFIFPGYIMNQFNDQLPVGLLAQLVRALHRYLRGQGSNPGKPDFFRLSFRNCISCVNNCEDLLYIYFFIPQFNIWISYIHNFITSNVTLELIKNSKQAWSIKDYFFFL